MVTREAENGGGRMGEGRRFMTVMSESNSVSIAPLLLSQIMEYSNGHVIYSNEFGLFVCVDAYVEQ